MTEKKLVVFDLDGTLNKTELYAVPAHKKALAELGIFDKTDELIISTFGARSIDSAHLLINTHDQIQAMDYLKKVSLYETEFITSFAGEFEGTSAMLDKLRNDGYIIAVCSNASERYIKMVLTALNIINKIDCIQPLLPDLIKDDTLRLLLKRENPDKAVMIGDRIFDKNVARANDIPFIGCMYGFDDSEVCDADVAVKTPSEINLAVKFLIGS